MDEAVKVTGPEAGVAAVPELVGEPKKEELIVAMDDKEPVDEPEDRLVEETKVEPGD